MGDSDGGESSQRKFLTRRQGRIPRRLVGSKIGIEIQKQKRAAEINNNNEARYCYKIETMRRKITSLARQARM